MKKMIAACLLLSACAEPPAGAPPEPLPLGEYRLVDLTHPFGEDTLYWPTAEGFRLIKGPEGVTEAGYFYNANAFEAAEHGGTHLDAPYHFHEGRRKVGEIPVEQLVGAAVAVDVERRSSADPDYRIAVADLQAWEAANGAIPEDSMVLLRTGYARYWPDPEKYLGTAEKGERAVAKLHFPGLHPEAARWLAEERSVKAVGIDTASIDFGQSDDFAAHVNLARHNILIFENLAGLGQLPPTGAQVAALPMKISHGSGAPLRIIALLPPAGGPSR